MLVLIGFILPVITQQGDVFAEAKLSGLFNSDSNKESLFNGYEGYTKMISTLLIVIALIIAAVYVLKKKYGVSAGMGRSRKLIQVIDHAPIGVKKSVFLVEVPGKHLLLGVTNDNIGLLTEIANEDIIVSKRSASGSDSVNKKEFLDIIKKSISERKQR
ncbi:flagellar biosynthetic protein FliO [Candidatus Scalindua japonica]|nr:flagellar biosynthetic protein FliO [Candidatus Scalindua japonica]